ncbi:hypothetical protein RB623_10565 [Mesorhizobium sp. LHD-90]|uniref:hypothetical protein n=1 Tax=Mesorhizobium sp. LHD-90 TaxID=3071414 RepID=UPI0027E0D98D|nr:hypothetical protein [Mesorhizobium sp. LHD-90]MDQ6434491.1 hypothetical protein [Mesorhizobium sp. LHD-90]
MDFPAEKSREVRNIAGYQKLGRKTPQRHAPRASREGDFWRFALREGAFGIRGEANRLHLFPDLPSRLATIVFAPTLIDPPGTSLPVKNL